MYDGKGGGEKGHRFVTVLPTSLVKHALGRRRGCVSLERRSFRRVVLLKRCTFFKTLVELVAGNEGAGGCPGTLFV